MRTKLDKQLTRLIENFCMVEPAYVNIAAIIGHLKPMIKQFLASNDCKEAEDPDEIDFFLSRNQYFVEEAQEVVSGLNQSAIDLYNEQKLWETDDWDIKFQSALGEVLFEVAKNK
jgi:hypothetical protein